MNDQGGEVPPRRLSKEELAKKYASDPEFATAAGEEEKDDDSIDSVLPLFRKALKHYCMALFWQQVESTEDADSVAQLARGFNLFRQQVYDARRGAMDADVFFCIMADKTWNYRDLRPLPPVSERALAAFRLTIQCVRSSTASPKINRTVRLNWDDPTLIEELEFFAVSFLLSDDLLRTPGKHFGNIGSSQWEEVVARVLGKLRRLTRFSENKLALINREYLLNCHRSWADHVVRVRDALPLKWITQVESKRSV